MNKTHAKVSLFALMLAAASVNVAAQLSPLNESDPLCVRNSDNGCDNSGCEDTGGVCGRATTSSPCWCLY